MGWTNILSKDLFGTAQLYELQLSFTNFTTEQLSLRVGEVDGCVWLADQSFTKMRFWLDLPLIPLVRCFDIL
jgi:hypothetical protein